MYGGTHQTFHQPPVPAQMAAHGFRQLQVCLCSYSDFRVSSFDFTLHTVSSLWLQYWICGVLREFRWPVLASENPPFQHCSHVIACRVQCAIIMCARVIVWRQQNGANQLRTLRLQFLMAKTSFAPNRLLFSADSIWQLQVAVRLRS